MSAARACRVCLPVVLILALLPVDPARAAWEPVPASAWQEPARPDSGGGDAIVLLERQECRQREDGFSVDYFARARVFSTEGRAIANQEILYVKKDWALKNLRARSVRPDGASVELNPANVIVTTAWKFRDYEVLKASIAIPGVEAGCMVEWGYTLSGPLGYTSGWRFPFSNQYYNCESQQVWRVPAEAWNGMKPAWRYANLFPGRVEERSAPDGAHPTSLTFTVRALEGVRSEPYAPPTADAGPRVEVRCEALGAEPTTHWSWWKSVFDDYQKLLGVDAEKLDPIVVGFRNGQPDAASALRAAFAWVQSNFTCIDEREWVARREAEKSNSAYHFVDSFRELLERNELSSFEINFLMATLASKLGFPACLGMTGDRELQRFDLRTMGFPPENFLTRVMIGGQPIFLEPASRFALFGSLPWTLRGGDCLLSGTTSDLSCRISSETGEPAHAEWSLDLDLSPAGAIGGHVAARLWGEEGAQWKRDLWEIDPARWPASLADILARGDGPRAVFDGPSLGAAGDTLLALRASAHWPAMAIADPDRIEIPCERLVPWCTHARFLLERRTQPVLIRYPRDEIVRVHVRPPAGFNFGALPPPAEFENELGSWSQHWSVVDGAATLERRVTLLRAEMPQRLYGEVRDYFNALDRADHAVLLAERTK